jgi:uncharacterized membrane protein
MTKFRFSGGGRDHAARVANHRNAMLAIFTGALIIAGAFTFAPGRIMHTTVFGN